jgi:hypothetical protein
MIEQQWQGGAIGGITAEVERFDQAVMIMQLLFAIRSSCRYQARGLNRGNFHVTICFKKLNEELYIVYI